MSDTLQQPYPLNVFNFWVDFNEASLNPGSLTEAVNLCGGAFSECTGLEVTMEPKVIKEGGRNYGSAQRVGVVTPATVMLKRGITRSSDLWRWFEMVSIGNAYAHRLTVTITLFNHAGEGVLSWQLVRALPIKFKAADFNAKSTEVGIEELHLVHEGLSLLPSARRASLHPSGSGARSTA